MRTIVLLATHGLALLIGAVGCFWAFDPVEQASQAQQAIIREFVIDFCMRPSKEAPPEMLIGATAALSRVSINAGIGKLAQAEYYRRCINGTLGSLP